ncbi:heme-binding domain-containing protein [Leeuwenhoekiella marinoflava]|uniref:Heme-binding protein n=2 Tax=Leeuwenhoekiella marinoflava TaxID=988 RepID=A0A4Q0PMD9_9FLAO|nr:heme-binding domain-containing protein [Leeuwenhoekiella marinoflava]RXG30814.1 heme-binding protein [Leeuwenhoekiella marinoflava]SHF15618.1 Haem-binding domain-containing protein [Leeuwenhoekiella marinoflava DSM 3653]
MVWIKRLLILALIALIVIQFIPVEKNEGGYESLNVFVAETKPSDEVAAILKSACYDCHSNQTVYPWYSNLAPASFYLADHVDNGKRHLNFSAWDAYSTKRKDHKLDELIEEVEAGEMPLESYMLIHSEATLDAAQTEALVNWAKAARLNYSEAFQPQ